MKMGKRGADVNAAEATSSACRVYYFCYSAALFNIATRAW